MLSTSKKSAHFRRSCATSRDLQCHILTQGGRTRTQGSSRFRRYTRLATLMYTSLRRLNPSPGFTSYSRNLHVTNKAETVTSYSWNLHVTNNSRDVTLYSRNLHVTNKADTVTAGYTVRLLDVRYIDYVDLRRYFKTYNSIYRCIFSYHAPVNWSYVFTQTDKLNACICKLHLN